MAEKTTIVIAAVDQASEVFRRMQGNVERLQSSFARVSALLGAGIGVGAFAALIKSTLDAGDELNKLSQKTGIAVERLSALKYAAGLSGVDTQALAKGIKGLSLNMIEANDSTSKAARVFKAMGVDISGGVNPTLTKLADVFSRLEDGELKAALAVQVFGKAGMDMIPFLNQGSVGITKLTQEAERLGLVMSSETAKAAEQFNDNLRAIKASSEGLGISLLNRMAPAMVKISEAMKAAAEDAGVLKALLVGFGGVLQEAFGRSDAAALLQARLKIVQEITKYELLISEARIRGWNTEGALTKGQEERLKILREQLRVMQMQDALAKEAPDNWDARFGGTKALVAPNAQAIRDALSKQAEANKEAERLRLLDMKGWVEYAEVVFAESDKLYTDLAKISDDHWKLEEALKKEDLAGWVRYAEEVFKEADETNRAIAAANEEFFKQQEVPWRGFLEGIESAFRDSWSSFTMHGKNAAQVLRDALKRTLFDWIYQSLARPIVLQVVAGLAGSMGMTGLANAATGAVGSAASSWLMGAAGGAGGAAAGAAGGAAGTAGMSVLGATGWGLAIVAAVALYNYLKGKEGGPKDEGQYITGGAPGFNIVGTSANSAMQDFATGLLKQINATIAAFGGTPGAFQVGAGIVRDPSGSSPTFIDTLLRTESGQELLRIHNANVGRSPEEAQAEIEAQGQRAILAALQASQFPEYLAAIFNSVDPATASAEEIAEVFARATKAQEEYTASVIAAAAAAEKLKQDWEAVQQSIDTLTGRNRVPGQLDSAAALFAQGNSWAQGLTTQQLIEALSTITEADFANYSEANRELIKTILALAASIAGLDQSVDQVVVSNNTLYNPSWVGSTEQWKQQYGDKFNSSYSGVIGSQPTMMDQLSLRMKLMQEQVVSWQAQYTSSVQSSGAYSPQSLALQQMIQSFQQIIGKTTQFGATGLVADLAKLTILTAQYGEAKAEELFNLQKWYDEQKTLIGGNNTALLALEELYQQRRTEIVENGLDDSLTKARERIADYMRSLLMDPSLSTLSPMERLDAARREYERILALSQGGDLTAMGNLTGSSDAYLKIAREIFASSSGYVAIFEQVISQLGGIATGATGLTFNEAMLAVLPQNTTLASSADLGRILVVLERIANEAEATTDNTAAIASTTTTVEPR